MFSNQHFVSFLLLDAIVVFRTFDFFYIYKGAVIDHEWTGLRPTRVPIRIEKEILQLKKGRLVVSLLSLSLSSLLSLFLFFSPSLL